MIDHTNKLIYIHIPRTGGTPLEHFFVEKDWDNIAHCTKHIDCRKAKEIYFREWDSYLKVTSIRNPWEWIVSLYFSHNRHLGKTWDEYVNNPNLLGHEQILTSQDEMIGEEMDFIIRFENLQADFEKLCEKVGATPITLPHINYVKTPHKHYSTYYNKKQKEIIAERFKRDIDRFGYNFK